MQGGSDGLAQRMEFPDGCQRESHKRKEQPLQRPWGGKVKDMGSQDTIAEEVVGRQAWIGSRAHSLTGKAKPSVFTWS